VAAAIGQPLNIPVIVRSLAQDMYRVGMTPRAVFRPGFELMSYLDGNLSSNGLDDPALGIKDFDSPWWTRAHAPTGFPSYLCWVSLGAALDRHRRQLEEAVIPSGAPQFVCNLADELNKPAYTWHSSVNDDMPNSPTDCTRCRLYRAVAVGVMDQLRDTYNMAHACEIANQAEKDIAMRRASGFNELFEAALKKECDVEEKSGSGETHEQESGSGSNGKGKERRFGPEVEGLKTLVKNLVKDGAIGSSKWTWGVSLTEDDLRGLIRGADRQYQVPHSGYDRELPSESLQSQTSEALDLEDPNDQDLRFEELSRPIIIIPDLRPHEIPTYSTVLLGSSGDAHVDSDPDPVVDAFTKRAKAQATNANKLLMQDEVDQPVSYRDFGSEFMPRTALIPRRPWLAPRLPIILPPTNNATDHVMRTDSDPIDEFPNHIIIPDSDDISDHITIPGSDDIPDNIIIPDSDSIHSSSPIRFLPSDNEGSDAMDVVVSTDSESDSPSVIFPESPMATRHSIGGSGVIERDPNTGHFTAASFANFPDELLE
jgi:hypothetical protein